MLAEGKKECRPIDGAAAEIKSVLGRTTMKHSLLCQVTLQSSASQSFSLLYQTTLFSSPSCQGYSSATSAMTVVNGTLKRCSEVMEILGTSILRVNMDSSK